MRKAPKKAAGPTPEEIQAQRAAVIDELGRLDLELAAAKQKQERAKVLKATVLSWLNPDLPAEQGAIFDGTEYSAQVSAQDLETAITDLERVYNTLGKEKFLSLCGFTLKNLNANLSPAMVAAVTEKKRTGSRAVKPLRRAA